VALSVSLVPIHDPWKNEHATCTEYDGKLATWRWAVGAKKKKFNLSGPPMTTREQGWRLKALTRRSQPSYRPLRLLKFSNLTASGMGVFAEVSNFLKDSGLY
jgi:hypothetical protein